MQVITSLLSLQSITSQLPLIIRGGFWRTLKLACSGVRNACWLSHTQTRSDLNSRAFGLSRQCSLFFLEAREFIAELSLL